MMRDVDAMLAEVRAQLAPLRGARVLVAMSGGVDSSLAAALLLDAGAEPVGVFMHLWDYAPDESGCCTLSDARDARRVAEKLGIPFYVVDMRKPFADAVVEDFASEYARGRTPNPCARCNRFVKFGALARLADELGIHWIATGHYARKTELASPLLRRARDAKKDQTYFLATTPKEALARAVFPLGGFVKDETRALAAAWGLPTAHKRESQDVCFVPDGDRVGLLARIRPDGLAPGPIVEQTTGRVLGRHKGLAHYTIGQRRGLGLAGGPWRVVALDAAKNAVVVARAERLVMRAVRVGEIVWFAEVKDGEVVQAKLRYRMPLAPMRVQREGDTLRLVPLAPVEPSAPGQVAALYRGEQLVAGGIVEEVKTESVCAGYELAGG